MSELSELFDRDPFGFTDQDLDIIIKRMREAQAQYELGVKTPVAAKPKKPTKSQEMLKDLGLE